MKKSTEYENFKNEIRKEEKHGKQILWEIGKKQTLTHADRKQIYNAESMIENKLILGQMLLEGGNVGRAKKLNLRAFSEEPEEYTDEHLKALRSMRKKEWDTLEYCFWSFKSEEFERLYGSLIEVIRHTIYVRLSRKKDFIFMGREEAFNLFYGWVKGELSSLSKKGISHHSVNPAISDNDDLSIAYEDGGIIYDRIECQNFEEEFLQSIDFVSDEIKRRVFVNYQIDIEKRELHEVGRRLGGVMEDSSRGYWYEVAIKRPELVDMVFDRVINERKRDKNILSYFPFIQLNRA